MATLQVITDAALLALSNKLATLSTTDGNGATRLAHVWTDAATNVSELPAIVVTHDGLAIPQLGQAELIGIKLTIQAFVAGLDASTRNDSSKAARHLAEDMVDALMADQTLGATITLFKFLGDITVTGLKWGEADYAGFDVPAVMWTRTGQLYG